MSQMSTEKLSRITASLDLLNTGEVAAILGVSRKLVTMWIAQGVLPAVRLGPGQRLLRIRRVDLEAFITSKGQTNPQALPDDSQSES